MCIPRNWAIPAELIHFSRFRQLFTTFVKFCQKASFIWTYMHDHANFSSGVQIVDLALLCKNQHVDNESAIFPGCHDQWLTLKRHKTHEKPIWRPTKPTETSKLTNHMPTVNLFSSPGLRYWNIS
jgi:hypothetical protein